MMKKDQILSLILLFFLLFAAIITTMADSQASQPSNESKVHIVYTEQPENQEPEEYHIKTLTSVLGSEEAAKEALLYSYKHATSGFSAKLTAEQVKEIQSWHGELMQLGLDIQQPLLKPLNL